VEVEVTIYWRWIVNPDGSSEFRHVIRSPKCKSISAQLGIDSPSVEENLHCSNMEWCGQFLDGFRDRPSLVTGSTHRSISVTDADNGIWPEK
jgi:hypothetical protein